MGKTTCAAAFVMVLVCLPQAARGGWIIETVDQTGDVGSHCSLALDALNQPCISYHNETDGTLKLACFGAMLTEPTWIIETVPDSELPVGDYSALAIVDGIFHVAYRQGSDVYSSLKYAQLLGGPGGDWLVEEVDHANQGVGHDISMAIDADGFPHIAHAERWGQRTVRYARWTGAAWVNQTIFKDGAEDTAIVLLGNQPQIAIAGAYLGLAKRAGKKWKVEVVDPDSAESVDMVAETSVTGDILHVVYGAYTDSGVDLRHRTWSEAVGWSESAFIDGPLEYSPDISLAIHGSDLHLTYYDQMNGALRSAFYSGSWTPSVLDDSSGEAGLFSSIAVGTEGEPSVAYYDAIAQALKFATLPRCDGFQDCQDGNDCTLDTCSDGQCLHTPQDGDVCGTNGICVQDLCVEKECTIAGDCPTVECAEASCVDYQCRYATGENCCGNGVCEVDEMCSSCPADCAEWTTEDSCGNGICEPALEDCQSCPSDCRQEMIPGAFCGNGVCEISDGEDCESCPEDCAGLATGKPTGRFCCGVQQDCSDSRCTVEDYDCTADPSPPVPGLCCGENADDCLDPACTAGEFRCSDGGAYQYCCGDATCESYEDRSICSIDLDFDFGREPLAINYEFHNTQAQLVQGSASVDEGETLYLHNEPGGWYGYPDIAECRSTCSGQVQAYYHDSLSGPDLGTFGPLVSSGCSRAEEYGYRTVCCIDLAVP